MADLAQLLDECLRERRSGPCGAFLRELRRDIAFAVVAACRPFGEAGREAAEDLVQETYVRLCRDSYRSLQELRGDGPRVILAFVRSVATSVTLDHFRALGAQKRFGGLRVVPVDEGAEHLASSSSTSAVERQVLLEQIDRKIREMATEHAHRDRAVFWLHYRHGMTARDIAGIPHVGLTVKGVESLLFRLVNALRESFPEATKGSAPELRLEGRDR